MRTHIATKERFDSLIPTHISLLILGGTLLALGMLAPPVYAQTYVDASAGAGSGDGSQANPYGDLQTALANTSSGEIRVAAGTYYPDEGQGQTADDRNATFNLRNGVTIIGGFDASNWNAPPTPSATPTFLSGDITQDDAASPVTDPQTQITGDNSIHVVTAQNLDATAQLEGVTITAGNANVSGNNGQPDDGGGLYISSGDGPTIRNVTITGNRSVDDAGGVNVNSSQPTFVDIRVTNNYTEGLGAGISIDGAGSGAELINAVIVDNVAGANGGGIYVNRDADLTLINATLVRNTSNGNGGGIFIRGSGIASVSNSILTENTASGGANQIQNNGTLSSSNNLLAGGNAGVDGTGSNTFSGTLDADPQFADPATNDFRLQGPGSGGGASAAIDAGLNSALDLDNDGTVDVTSDLNGNPRIQDATGSGSPIVDLGAFESDGSPLPVELANFTAQPDGRSVQLAWSTVSETNNVGFYVQHRAPGIAQWSDLALVEGALTTDQAQSYLYTVENLDYGTHRFRLRQVDVDGTSSLSRPVQAELRIDASFAMQVNPNPVRHRARVNVTAKTSQTVSVSLFDVLGRKVQTLHEGALTGSRTERLSLDASGLSSGVYFLRMVGEKGTETRKVVVTR